LYVDFASYEIQAIDSGQSSIQSTESGFVTIDRGWFPGGSGVWCVVHSSYDASLWTR